MGTLAAEQDAATSQHSHVKPASGDRGRFVSLLCGLAAAWIAAGSTGLLGHALRQTPEGRFTYKFDPGIAAAGVDRDFAALWDDVRRVRCPTLLVRGGESPILARETAERFSRELPGAAVAEVAGAGHSVMGDNPAGFLAAVGPFLARHGR